MFSICLGKNGGFMQIGGFHLKEGNSKSISWYKDLQIAKSYMFQLSGVSMHDHFLKGSENTHQAFIDSGTTFTYFPNTMWDALMFHFDYFCEQTKDIKDEFGQRLYCPGERVMTTSQGEQVMCFKFDASVYDSNRGNHTVKDFLMSYPIIKFHAKDLNGK